MKLGLPTGLVDTSFFFFPLSSEENCTFIVFQALANSIICNLKVDELDKAITVAARDPALYGINEVELEKRRGTSTARTQVKYCFFMLQRVVEIT